MLTSRGLGRVLGDLAALGYDAEWGVLGACDAGAPHRRERIWILAASEYGTNTGVGQAPRPGLATMARQGLIPTPTVHDAKKLCASQMRRSSSLPAQVLVGGGLLSPMWVEWLMAWPIGWTDSQALETGKSLLWLRSHGASFSHVSERAAS